MVLSFCYGVTKQTQSEQWTWAMDPSFPARSFQKLPFAKWQTAWLATTKAFRGCMNRGLSQERLVEMRPFCFYPSREAEWSRAGFRTGIALQMERWKARRLFVLLYKLCLYPTFSIGGCSPSCVSSAKPSLTPVTSVMFTLTCSALSPDLP